MAETTTHERWELQRELLESDPETGVDPEVLALVAPHPASSHNVWTEDGTRINYKRFGEGSETIIFANGLGGTYRTFADVIGRLLDRFQVLVFDYRGLFESGVPEDDATLTVPQHARDLLAVADAAGVGRFSLFGWSMGVQVALETYHQAPERIEGMVFASGVAGNLLSTVYNVRAAGVLAPAFVRWMQRHGAHPSSLLARAVQRPGIARMAKRLRLVGRNAEVTMRHAALLFSTDPKRYWKTVENLDAHDASEVLGRIAVPVLILHGDSDVVTPVSQGIDLRTRIPGSEIWVFPHCTHAVILEFPEQVALRTLGFLERRVYDAAT